MYSQFSLLLSLMVFAPGWAWAQSGPARASGGNGLFLIALGALLLLQTGVIALLRRRAQKALHQTRLDLEERVRERTSKLKSSEHALRAILNSIYDGIILHEVDGSIIDLNNRAQEILGVDRREASGRNVQDTFACHERAGDLPVLWQLAAKGQPQFLEWTAVQADTDETIDVEVYINSVPYYGRVAILCNVRDISKRKRAERRLAETQALLLSVIDQMPSGVIVADPPDAKVRLVNKACMALTGVEEGELRGMRRDSEPRYAYFDADGNSLGGVENWPLPAAVLHGKATTNAELILRRADGSERWVLANAVPVRDDRDEIVAGVAVNLDITEYKQAQEALREAEARYRALIENFPRGSAALVDAEGRYLVAGGEIYDRMGIKPGTLAGMHLREVWPPETYEQFRQYFDAVRSGHKVSFEMEIDEGVFEVHLVPTLDRAGQLKHVVTMSFEITERKRSEARLMELATLDGLTGIFNRRHFMELAQREFSRSRRYGLRLSLLMIDADHFKKINDTHGHSAGDMVLRALARKAGAILRDVDVFARFGGEEFAALLPETDLEEARVVAERLCMHLAERPVVADEVELRLTVSVGVAEMEEHIASLDELIKAADEALYLAKERGRNQVVAHVPEKKG